MRQTATQVGFDFLRVTSNDYGFRLTDGSPDVAIFSAPPALENLLRTSVSFASSECTEINACPCLTLPSSRLASYSGIPMPMSCFNHVHGAPDGGSGRAAMIGPAAIRGPRPGSPNAEFPRASPRPLTTGAAASPAPVRGPLRSFRLIVDGEPFVPALLGMRTGILIAVNRRSSIIDDSLSFHRGRYSAKYGLRHR